MRTWLEGSYNEHERYADDEQSCVLPVLLTVCFAFLKYLTMFTWLEGSYNEHERYADDEQSCVRPVLLTVTKFFFSFFLTAAQPFAKLN